MKITLDELKRTVMYELLPIDEMRFLTDSNYLVFYYWYDDTISEITDIQGVKIVNDITFNLNRNPPLHGGNQPYSLGYFQAPFDTQNVLFYQFLKYYFSYARKLVDKNSEHYRVNNPILLQFFAKAKASDLESIEARQKNTMYENVFRINSRSSYVNAVERFVRANNQVLEPLYLVSDAIETYYSKIKNKSFYGGCLDKIVMAVGMPQGGLIAEQSGKLRYLYVGENSKLSKEDASLKEAKEMLRSNFSYNEIYAKTNWFFNKHDQKWRKTVIDKDVTIPNLPVNTMFMKSDSKFKKDEADIFRYMNDSDSASIQKLLADGWDIYLSDVLKHPTLYKHYPSLFQLPIFYGVNNRGMGEGDYSFYYNPKGYLMMIGNEAHFDFKTVLLHEVQHAIQGIEGFAQGGNRFVAKMIQAIGGENVKGYYYAQKKITQLYKLGATSNGRYSYEQFNRIFLKIGKLKNSVSESEYYSDIDNAINILLNLYLNAKGSAKTDLENYLGTDVSALMELILGYYQKAQQSSTRLVGQGYSRQDISTIFFKSYEGLAGELESRDVQHNVEIEEEILGYVTPLTSESIKEKDITSVFEDLLTDEKLPPVIKGAIENIEDEKYIMHLFESVSAQPILHELGHIVADLMGRSAVDLTIANNLNAKQIVDNGGIEETFCELFLCYLAKQNFTPRFTNDLVKGRTLMDVTIFDEDFGRMFLPKVNEAQEKELSQRLFFVEKLRELVENTMIEVPKEEIVEQMVNEPLSEDIEVVQETPIATESSTELEPEEQAVEVAVADELPSFIERLKGMFKEDNEWHFINTMVNGHSVKAKFFIGKKEVDVQILKIDYLHHSLKGNYMGKKETLNQMIDKFNTTLK